MFKRTKVCTGVLLALGGAVAATSMPTWAQDTQRVEITGSRIKRAAAEGSLPVTVIGREELQGSGSVSIAEFMRTSTFASFGQYRPQSGSSFAGFAGINLRGLGEQRTLVLLDGRRLAKAPQVGTSADLNSIPMAAVERIEILTDGASAIYGSDAIGGVVNFILRKDFEGGVISYGQSNTSWKGGDREEFSAVFGLSGDKGRMIIGAQANSRDIIFQRDYPWTTPGLSPFSNNFYTTTGTFIAQVPNGCNDPGFSQFAQFCVYDFTSSAADEAEVKNRAVFARGEVFINEDWTAYLFASVGRTSSFGRYAPVPGNVQIAQDSPANLIGHPTNLVLRHRFAAGGTRDDSTDTNLYDLTIGVTGQVAGWDVDLGMRKTQSQFYRIGRGYVVESLARDAINSGAYDFVNPASNPASVLQGFTTDINRDAVWDQKEFFASASRDLFAMGGGNAALFVGIEYRTEDYFDQYDSLSEGGVILGSAGNSAGGGRNVTALGAELLMPISRQLEATLSARYEKYSDYGSDFSPKASLRFQATPDITLRASVGRGFGAPSLPELTQKPSFSADSIVDVQHCIAQGFPAETCNTNPQPSFQIDGTVISNPALSSEKSTNISVGGVWDVTPNLSLEATLWSIKIKDVISAITAQEIVRRDTGLSPLPVPAGLSITRDPSGNITSIIRGSTNEGTLERQGIDVSALFAHQYAGIGQFRHRLNYSHVNKAKTNGVERIGDFAYPKDRVSIRNVWEMGPFTAGWNINMIGKHGDDSVGFVGSYTTHDVQFGWATPVKGLKLTLGAVNVTKKLPQLVSQDTRPFEFDLYDGYGRQVYGRIEVSF